MNAHLYRLNDWQIYIFASGSLHQENFATISDGKCKCNSSPNRLKSSTVRGDIKVNTKKIRVPISTNGRKFNVFVNGTRPDITFEQKKSIFRKTEQNSLERNKENFQIFKWNNKI